MKQAFLPAVITAAVLFFSSAGNGAVLILDDNSTQDSIYEYLSMQPYDVTLGGHYWEYTGDDLYDYQLILLLNGVSYGSTMPYPVQQKIREFVAGGGSLLTFEWVLWATSRFDTIKTMLPVRYGGSWSRGSEQYYPQLAHAVTASLPDSFTVLPNWSFSVAQRDTAPEKQALTLLRGSRSGDAVVVGRYEQGTAAHWNMAGHYNGRNIWSPEVVTLLRNLVSYLLGESRSNGRQVEYRVYNAAASRAAALAGPSLFYSAGTNAFTVERRGGGSAELRIYQINGAQAARLPLPAEAGSHTLRWQGAQGRMLVAGIKE